jgi:4-diphosphocytidyl-2-C-methyl-D-erythritol kinase
VSTRRIELRAPAKVNLTLAVLGRRPDGYHEIDSLMLALALGDRLVVEERVHSGVTLAVHGPAAAGVPADGTNLAVRAAEAVLALARAVRRPAPGLHLDLEKHVPAQGGLGGGSADAAAAALAAAELCGLAPDDPRVAVALSELGSDCVFFLAARATGFARCTGRGERVEPLPALVLPWSLAVLTPASGCATARVYAALGPLQNRPASAAPALAVARLATATLAELRASLSNDLEPAALRAHPELGGLAAVLAEHAPGAFRLAGSGSSWFGFFTDEDEARAVLARVESACEARRYALRGRWVLPAASRGLARV